MQNRCLIISPVFSDPWKSLLPNVDILLQHTLLMKARAVAWHPPSGSPAFPRAIYLRGWHRSGWGHMGHCGPKGMLGCQCLPIHPRWPSTAVTTSLKAVHTADSLLCHFADSGHVAVLKPIRFAVTSRGP